MKRSRRLLSDFSPRRSTVNLDWSRTTWPSGVRVIEPEIASVEPTASLGNDRSTSCSRTRKRAWLPSLTRSKRSASDAAGALVGELVGVALWLSDAVALGVALVNGGAADATGLATGGVTVGVETEGAVAVHAASVPASRRNRTRLLFFKLDSLG